MCGILGCYGSLSNRDSVESQIERIARRGPDSSGVWTASPSVTLISTRLAMVDRNERSNQPFVRDNRALVFNGEIFNHLELRETLCKDSYFETESDTETLFELINLYGDTKLGQLNGMYSFAYFDGRINRLLMARDKLGKKPLYFLQDKERVYFSSLLSPLLQIKSVPIKTESILNYLKVGFDPIYGSPFLGIEEVPPGSSIVFSKDANGTVKRNEATTLGFWHPRLKSEEKKNKRLKIAHFDDLRGALRDAVATRVEGQRNVGISLSGGVDSTVIAILLAELGVECTSYSVNWVNADKTRYNDDFNAAQQIAAILRIPFREVRVETPNSLLTEIDHYLEAVEVLNNNATGLSMMKLYEEMASHGIRCALTGDGADEILYGYPRYTTVDKFTHVLPNLSRIKMFAAVFKSDSRIRQLFSYDFDAWSKWHSVENSRFFDNLIDFDPKVKILSSIDSHRRFQTLLDFLPDKLSPVGKLSFLDLNLWLTKESNLRLDRVSMFYSIEARMPFQDSKVIENFWVDSRKVRSRGPKHMLFESFPELKHLPILRRKSGFISPIGHWMRKNIAEISHEIAYMHMGGLLKRPLDVKEILESGDFDSIKAVWTLLVYSRWRRMFA